ncbi:sigma 54-interacting transcriptional regulator [Desulfitobacterium sp. AusDCA]
MKMDGFISLGLSLLEWQKYVSTNVQSLSGKMPFSSAVNFFLTNHVTQAPVVDEDGLFLGIINSLSLMEQLNSQVQNPLKNYSGSLLENFVEKPEIILNIEDGSKQNLQQLIEQKIPLAFVINREGRLVGEIQLCFVAKALDQLLEDLEYFVTSVIESDHNGIVAINAQGTVIFYNNSAEQILGIPADKVIGNPVQQFFPDSLAYQTLVTAQPQRDVHQIYGDKSFKTDFLPIVTQDKVIGAVAIFKDITELKAVSDRLSHSERLTATLEAIVDNSYEGIIVIDEQERVQIINQFFLDILELKEEDVIGKSVLEVSPDSKLPETLKSGETKFGDTWQYNGKDYLIMRAPVEKNGKIIGALGRTLFKNMEVAKMFAKKVMRLEDDLAYYKKELHRFNTSQYCCKDIIGNSPRMQSAKTLLKRAALTNSTILLLGESGTGKEVFAHSIHEASLRQEGPFIKINCAAVPENLLESELFGYAEGAFTGARKGGKPGKFELADKGTIFLDEIGDMPLSMQAKLLRTIQEREVERLGGTQPIKIDVRIIAATNRDLHQMVIEHKFRLDLYYRLNVVSIELPPLRERGEDLELLTDALIERINHRLGTLIEGVSEDSFTYLHSYNWPGNIRELENILERAIIICDEPWIQPWHLSLPLRADNTGTQNMEESGRQLLDSLTNGETLKTLEEGLEEAERIMIHSALQKTQGNKMQAARLLGIHRSALYKKIAKHRLIH